MLNTLESIVTILAFFAYLFVEWPTIRRRWNETYPLVERFLIAASIVTGFAAIILIVLAVSSVFFEKSLSGFYFFAFFATFGLSYLIDHWIENKTFAYRRTSTVGSIWLLIVATFVAGIIGLALYWLGLR